MIAKGANEQYRGYFACVIFLKYEHSREHASAG